MRSRELPIASAAVKPKSRSAAGFQSIMRPSLSATIMASPAASTRACRSTWLSMLGSLLMGTWRVPCCPRMTGLDGHPQPIAGAERHGQFGHDRVLRHHLEGVGLGNRRQDEMHFHEGERFTDTHPRAFAKRDVGKTVPPGLLDRRKALRLTLLRRSPKIRVPMGDVLTDHHDGILRDGI